MTNNAASTVNEKESSNSEQQSNSPPQYSGFGFRYVEMVMLFLCVGFAYCVRVSTSVGIVAMTSENEHGFPVYDWGRSTQDTILSSFFWGYVIPQIPAGVIAGKFGGKLLLTISMFVNGLLNIALPFAAAYGWTMVCVCRILMGLAQGVIYPSVHCLLGKWCPPQERGRMGTFVYAGAQFGTVAQLLLAGVISASSWGWPAVYYSVGVVALIWTALWLILGSNSPAESRFVSNQEKKYMEACQPNVTTTVKYPVPWSRIISSLPVWCVVVAHVGQGFGFWVLLTEMPSYMSKVLHVDIKSNGFYSALPYMVMFVLSLFFSSLSDCLSNRRWLHINTLRKIFLTIAFSGPAVFLLGLAYLPAGDIPLAVTLLSLTVGLNGAHFVGFMMVHIDLSPNFASTLMGITNCISNLFSIVAPLSVSVVVKDETLASEWRKVFFIAIGFYVLANLFFVLFASSERQDWNEPLKPSSGFERTKTADEKSVHSEKSEREVQSA